MTDTRPAQLARPVLPPISARWWPGPTDPAPAVVLGAAASAGLAAAIFVPVDRPGLGWLLTAVAVAAAVLVVARREHSTLSEPSISRSLWVLAALALISVGTVRASEWLFALCVLAACGTASLAVASGRSVKGVVVGIAAIPLASLRALPWAMRGAARIRGQASASAVRLAWSVAVTAALLVVFGALFAGADAAFANILTSVLPTVDGGSVFQWILLFCVVGAGTVGTCYVLAAPPDPGAPASQPKPLRRTEWMLPVGVLLVLFTSFVLVQLTVLFGGSAYVLRTSGLTSAEYARRGFWQLAVVTVLALLVIGVAAWRAPTATRADRVWLRALLGGLGVLTLVIVASALSRMWAYQQAYGFTVLRVLVATCELWLGVVYLMVIAACLSLRATWLPRAVVGSAVAALLALAVLNPDGFIADRNVARYEETGKVDVDYLSGLSVDAAPELARLPEPLRSCTLSGMRYQLANLGQDDWRGWNVGRSAARDLIDGTYLRPALPCPPETGSLVNR
jgi:hypothetical protein